MMDRAILDPSLLETQLCTGTITLTLNPQNEICVLTKDIMRIIGIAKLRVAEIEEIVKKALEKEKVKLESQTGY
jgi:exosome complex component RRP45